VTDSQPPPPGGSSTPPPPGGSSRPPRSGGSSRPPRRPGASARGGARKGGPEGAQRTVAPGSNPPRGKGSGKGGRLKFADTSGWPRAKFVALKTLKWGSIVGLSMALIGTVTVFAIYKSIDIPNPNEDFEAQTTTVYYSDGKHVLGTFALQNRESIPLSQMPKSIQDAVISAEDRSFYTNSGIDVKGIIRAAWSNLRSDSISQGASTITQQYVKVLYLSQERTWTRKIKEAFLAVKLQNELSKDQILEGYLNTIYFGRGAYGVQAAAQAYFEKDAKDLTVPESAVLASVLNSPSALDPAEGRASREALLSRYRYVLEGMESMGNLDPATAAKFEQRLPHFPEVREVNAYGGQKGYLLTLVKNQLIKLGYSEKDIVGGGLKVTTTFDYNMQRDANKTVKKMRPKHRKDLHIALASVEPGTGALRALIGGRNYLQSQLNWATIGGQPGSTFKPYALAAAFEDGFTLQDVVDGSSPYTYPDGSTVHNEGESFGIPAGISYGPVTLLQATEDSINTAFADLVVQMGDNGPEKVVDAAVRAGIDRNSPGLKPNQGVFLGSATIPTVDMANGYATFAAKGKHADWYVIDKVSDAGGVSYTHKVKTDDAFTPAIVSNVTYALEQVVRSGTGTNAQALGRPAAGKTGTATAIEKDGHEHVSSSWFVGYTPQLSTAVMFVRGNGHEALDGGYLDPFFGGSYPTETWAAYMRQALAGEPVLDFPDPADIHGESPTYVPPPPTTTAPPPTTTAPTTTAPTTKPPTSKPPTSTPPTTSTTPPTTTTPTTTGPTATAPTQSALQPRTRPGRHERPRAPAGRRRTAAR
jgi:membrane peptidoglycan carboxypeptidase